MEITTIEHAAIVLTAARKVLTKKAHQPLNNQVDVTLRDQLLTELANRIYTNPVCEASARALLQELGVATEGESNG